MLSTIPIRSKDELVHEDLQFETIVSNFPGYVTVVDSNWKINYINKIPNNYNKNEVVGVSVLKFISPEYQSEYRSRLQKAIEGENQEMMVHVNSRNLKNHRFKVVMVPYKKNTVVIYSHNLEEDVQTEGYEQLFNMINNSRDEAYLIDANTLQFNHVNNKALGELGYSIDEIKSLKLSNITPSMKYFNNRFFRVGLALRGKKSEFTSKHKRKDGSIYEVSVSVSLVKIHNKKYLVGIARNITQDKLIQNEIELTKKELDIINQISNLTINSAGITEVAHKTLQAFTDLVPVVHGRFYRYNNHLNKLDLIAQKLEGSILEKIENKTGININNIGPCLNKEGIFKTCLETGQPLVLNDQESIIKVIKEHTDSKLLKTLVYWAINILNIRTFLIVPLVSKEKVFGLLTFSGQQLIDKKDFDLISRISTQMTAALAKSIADDDLNKQKNFIENITNNIPAEIAVFDINHSYTYVNSKAISNPDLRGWIIGKSDFDYCKHRKINVELATLRRQKFEEAISSKKTVYWIDDVRKENSKYILRAFHPVINNGKREVIGYGVDISERIFAEQQNAFLASIVSNSRDAIISMNHKGRILSWNNGSTLLFGYEDHQIINKTIYSLIPDENQRLVRNVLLSVKRGDSILNRDCVFINKQGIAIDVSVSMFLVDSPVNEDVLISAIIRDNREYVKNQAARMKALIEGEEKERKRISQDLHDGLGQVLSGLKLNLMALRKNLDQKHFDFLLDMADEAVKEYRAVTHNLSPSKLEENGIVSALQQICESTNHLGQIKMNLFFPDEPLVIPKQIESEMYRICQELINNAMKYSQASVIDIILDKKKDRISLTVIDNGVGFKVGDLRNGNKTGGIGLNNMNARAELFNGKFKISSTPKKGTMGRVTFRV